MSLPKIGFKSRGIIFVIYSAIFLSFLIIKLNFLEVLFLAYVLSVFLILGVYLDFYYLKKSNFINEMGLKYLEEFE